MDSDERWLLINALAAYRDAVLECSRVARKEADTYRRGGMLDYANAHDHIANEWDRTLMRIRALNAKLQSEVE